MTTTHSFSLRNSQRPTGRRWGALLLVLALVAAFAPPAAATALTYYVDADATGSASGTSWANAFPTLQNAATKATSGDTIWLAKGVYYPDEGTGQTNNDSTAHITLASGVKLYGGFDPGVGVTTFATRDAQKYPSVLSGDIDKNDTTDAAGVVATASGITGTNSLHVLYLNNPISSATVIDGVIITAGAATGTGTGSNGGGLYCDAVIAGGVCSPTLTSSTFAGNTASDTGGALYAASTAGGTSSPTLTNVTFVGNTAESGGAIYNNGVDGTSSPLLDTVAFTGNQADYAGGAIYNDGATGTSSPTLNHITFTSNHAEMGGAIYNAGTNKGTSSPTLTNSTFAGNTATYLGGAIYNNGTGGLSSPILSDSTFTSNTAGDNGGAIYNDGGYSGISSPTLTNSTFAGNPGQ